MDLHSVRYILKLKWPLTVIIVGEVLFLILLTLYRLDSLNVKEIVTWLVDNVAGQLIVGFILLLIGYYFIERKREARRIKREGGQIQKEKLEQEQNKEVERKNEKGRISKLLSSEIEDIQKELKPLSNCRNKAFNEYDNISEEDKLPEELNFYNSIYSNMGNKLELLDIKCQIKLSRYHKKIETIKEQYKNFELIHGDLPYCLSIIELGEVRRPLSSPGFDEICKFLESTENVYKLGEELIKFLKK